MPKGLPKSYIKKYGITKEAWRKYRASTGKSKKRSSRSVTTTAKKRRSRRYSTKRKRRRDTRVPAETMIAGAAIPFTPAADGFASPWDCLQSGDWQGLMDNAKTGFLGFDPQRGSQTINLIGLINPFDMQHGRYSKMLAYSGIAYKIRQVMLKRFAGINASDLMRKIPFIGRMVK